MKTLKEFKKDYKGMVKQFVLEKDFKYKLQTSLDEALVLLRNFRNKYDKTHDNLRLEIEVEEGYYGDGPTVSVDLVGNRLETPEEFTKRVETAYAQHQRWDDKSRAEYEKLKKIYGN